MKTAENIEKMLFSVSDYLIAMREVPKFSRHAVEEVVVRKALGSADNEVLPRQLVKEKHQDLLVQMGYHTVIWDTKTTRNLPKTIPLFRNQAYRRRYLSYDSEPAGKVVRKSSWFLLGNYVARMLDDWGYGGIFYDLQVSESIDDMIGATLRRIFINGDDSNRAIPPWESLGSELAKTIAPSTACVIFEPGTDKPSLFLQEAPIARINVVHEIIHFYLYHFVFKNIEAACEEEFLLFEMAAPCVYDFIISCLWEVFAALQTADVLSPYDYFNLFGSSTTFPKEGLASADSPPFTAESWRRKKRQAWQKVHLFKSLLPRLAKHWTQGTPDHELMNEMVFPKEFTELVQDLRAPILQMYNHAILDQDILLACIRAVEEKAPLGLICDSYAFNDFMAAYGNKLPKTETSSGTYAS